jgi:hypothetical protein
VCSCCGGTCCNAGVCGCCDKVSWMEPLETPIEEFYGSVNSVVRSWSWSLSLCLSLFSFLVLFFFLSCRPHPR